MASGIKLRNYKKDVKGFGMAALTKRATIYFYPKLLHAP
jgi:hypothetical protein